MNSSHAYALILAGGGGTRLWPASRRARPKQVLTLGGSETLLGACFRRAKSFFGADHVIVVTAADQAAAIREQIPGLLPQNLVAEPVPRNTAAAIGLGAIHVARRAEDDAVLAVIPSDAYIGDEEGFARCLAVAVAAAKGAVVTIGLRPRKPETGFGYLQMGEVVSPGVHRVARFVEKPDLAHAQEYCKSSDYLWNSGMFFFTARRLLAEIRLHMPALGDILDILRDATAFEGTTARLYPSVPAISIDYGVMEKTDEIHVVPADFGWNDVGSWAALDAIRTPDCDRNVTSGDTVVIHSKNSIVLSEPGSPCLGVVGVENMVIVATKDAVLVVPKDKAQDVREVVEALKKAGRTDLL